MGAFSHLAWSDSNELPELLEVPRWLTRDRQRSLALSVVQRAMEVEGRAIAAEVQFDGRLPRWAAVGLIADELRQNAPLRLVNVSKATAAAFIENMHTPQALCAVFNTRRIVQDIVNILDEGVNLVGQWSGSAENAAVLETTSKVLKAAGNDSQVSAIPDREN